MKGWVSLSKNYILPPSAEGRKLALPPASPVYGEVAERSEVGGVVN